MWKGEFGGLVGCLWVVCYGGGGCMIGCIVLELLRLVVRCLAEVLHGVSLVV